MKTEKKNFIFVIGIFLLFLCGFILGWVGKGMPPSLPLPTETPPIPAFASGTFPVIRVVDGDTIEIEGEEKVRYIGIDAPEAVDPRKPVQCFGIEASKKNKELVEGKTVRLEKDITDRDKYSRLLRYVWAGGVFINLELVKQGFASSYSYPPDIKYQKEFLAAEREAREARRGLWGSCPIVATPTINVSEASNSVRPFTPGVGFLQSSFPHYHLSAKCSMQKSWIARFIDKKIMAAAN